MSTDPPQDPIGLPSWPSETARQGDISPERQREIMAERIFPGGTKSSRQQEREAREEAAGELVRQQLARPAEDPAERRHRDRLIQLEHIADGQRLIIDQLARLNRSLELIAIALGRQFGS